jgi:hypothetical protein
VKWKSRGHPGGKIGDERVPTKLPADVKLIVNPHARVPLPDWIITVVNETRAESRRLNGRAD